MTEQEFKDKAALLMLEKILERGTFSEGIMGATETRAQREGIAMRCWVMADAMAQARERYNGN